MIWYTYLTKVKYHCYIVIINKCDKIPAYLYLAKQISLIMVFIYQNYPYVWFHWLGLGLFQPFNEQYIPAEMPLPSKLLPVLKAEREHVGEPLINMLFVQRTRLVAV